MRKTKNRRNKSLRIILVLSAAVFLLSAAILLSGYITDAEEENELETLVNRVKISQDTVLMQDRQTGLHEEPVLSEQNEELMPSEEAAVSRTTKKMILDKYSALYQENPDMGGWIRIDGTTIDYPVMFTPDEPEKYLHLSFKGKYSKRGVPFIGEGCALSPRSQNIVLYGHHMKNGSMFAAIVNYKDVDYLRKHPTICFSTLYEESDYEIFAVFETDIYAAERLRCYNFTCARDEADFNEYIEAIREAALYDTGVDVAYADELLTLSTCSYHTSDGRFVVVAKKAN